MHLMKLKLICYYLRLANEDCRFHGGADSKCGPHSWRESRNVGRRMENIPNKVTSPVSQHFQKEHERYEGPWKGQTSWNLNLNFEENSWQLYLIKTYTPLLGNHISPLVSY